MSRRSKSSPQPADAADKPEAEERKAADPQRLGPFTLDDDRVWSVPKFCEIFLDGLSVDTFERICKAGNGPQITWLSPNRKGVRGRHGKEWLDARAKASA
jgi:hypothetical protein